MPTYTLNNVNYTYTVGTVAASVGSSASASGNISLLSSFVVGGATYNVTSIVASAFQNCYNLITVIIPESVTSIGDSAFNNCSNLTTATLPSTLTIINTSAFQSCVSLTSINIPSTLTTLGGSAFKGCSSLTSVVIPNVTRINISVFMDCISLTSITIPNTVTLIDQNAFKGCSGLTSIAIPASVNNITETAFYGVGENLLSITVAPTNTYFISENGALCTRGASFRTLFLYSSASLTTSFVIPSTVYTVNKSAFWKSKNLTSITIANDTANIADFAFFHLTSLTNIVINADHPAYLYENGVLFNKAKTNLILYSAGLSNTSYVIPNTVSTIAPCAFSGCTNLTSITIPTSVTRIQESTFYGCSNLASFTIPTSITSIGVNAFYGCSSLTSITIPASVTTIFASYNVFGNCTNLSSIVVNASNPSFSSQDGVLFDKNKQRLITYPPALPNNLYVIPNTVAYITTYAFWKCVNLTTVKFLKNNPQPIENNTFEECNNLTTVIFSDRIPTIYPNNFKAIAATAVYPNTSFNTTLLSNLYLFANVISQPIPILTDLSGVRQKAFGDPPFSIIPPTSNVSGGFTYTSYGTSIITISGDIATVVGIGNDVMIVASQTLTTSYGAGTLSTTAEPIAIYYTVKKGSPTLSFSIPAKKVGDASFLITAPTTNSTGTFSYTSSNTGVASVSGNQIYINGAGVTTITATQATTTYYLQKSIAVTFAVNAATATITPTLTNFSVPAKIPGSAAFSIVPPTSDSSGAFTYTSSNTAVATISGTTVTVVAVGSSTITATQAGNATYKSGAISSVFIVSLTQPTYLTNFSVGTKTFGDASFNITPPTTNGNGLITYTSSNLTVATIVGSAITIVGAGTATITANQSATGIYMAATTTSELTVNKATPTITNFSVLNKVVGDASFNLVDPTSDGNGAFTYTSSDTSVATVAGNVVTIIGVGTSTITAVQASTNNYLSGSLTTTLTVNQGTTILTNFSVPAKSIGNADFVLVPPTTKSTGLITYTSSNEEVATIAGNVLTIVGVGSSTITASQEMTANYTSATITSLFTVGQAATITDFSVPAKTFGDVSFNLVAPTSDSDGLFTYTSSDTTVATIDGSTVTIVGGGTATITAVQGFTEIYGPGSITAPLVVSQATTVLTDFSVATKTFGDVSFNIVPPTTNGNGAFTYTSSDTSVATIDGNTVTIVGGGSSTITAVQASTANFLTESIPATFTVNQATPTITNFSVPAKILGDASFNLVTPTSNSSGLFTYTSSNTAVATIDGNVVTIVGNGISIITATQESTTNYLSGSIAGTFIVRLTPVITDFSVSAKTFGDEAFNIIAPTTDSDGVFTYTSSNTAVAIIDGSSITVVGAGSATITAVQSITVNYISGTITAPLVVSQATPILTDFSVAAKTYLDAPFTITPPTTNSPGDFTYTSSDTSVATIDGNTITIVGGGSSTITAVQASTANFVSTSIPATFTVNQATPTISNFVVPAKIIGDASFNLVDPTSNSTGLYTYTSSNTSVATIDGNVVTIVGNGISTITATQESTTNFLSGSITDTFIVRLIPTITNFSVPAKTFGDDSFTITPPTTDSDGDFTYTSSNTDVAIIEGSSIIVVGAGSATITADQSLTINYISGTITAPLVVSQATPVLTDFSLPPKTYVDFPFAITPPITNSPGAFTYTSSDTSVVTVAENMITIVGAGTATITATQESSVNFLTNTITAPITVSQSQPTFYHFYIPPKLVEDVSFIMSPPSGTSTGLYTYTSSDTSIATIEGDVVTILGKGTTIITANQQSTANYLSDSISSSLVIRLKTVMSDFSVPSKTYGDAPFDIIPPTTNSNGSIRYRTTNPYVATVVGRTITILSGGTTLISAYQEETTDYEAKEIGSTLVVIKATTVLSDFAVPAKIYGDEPFEIIPPTTNSNGILTYTSSDATVATVSGSTITIVGPGSATITANQPNTFQYLANSIATTLTVGKAPPVITDFYVPEKIVGDESFTITDPTTNSPGAFTYTSSNLAVATITNNTITIVGVGSSIITATQETTTNYLSGTTTVNFQVNQITTVLSDFSVPAKTYEDASFNLVAPTTNSPGLITYTSSNTEVATVTNNTVTIVGAGSSIITANQASTTNYLAGTTNATLDVSKATTVLSNFAVGTKTYGDASFNIIAPTTNSNGEITYTSSNTAVATVSGNTITIVGAGSSTITVNQATNTNYLEGTVDTTLTINKATTVLTNFLVPIKVIRNAPFSITPPTSNSDGSLTYTSSNEEVATISGTTITIVGIGFSTITVNQDATDNYLAATTTAVFQVNNVTPTLAFSIPPKAIVDAPYTIAPPTSNSTGSFTYTSSNPSVATIVNGLVTMVALGTTTITAVQAETADYITGTISATLTVIKGTPGLTFSIPPKNLGNPTFLITPTTGSDGAITYTSSDTSVATVTGNRVRIVAVGTSTITAVQASTATYFSETSSYTLEVSLSGTVLSMIPFSVKKFNDIPFKIQTSSNSSGAITYTSSDTSVATIAGDMITIVAAGTASITATQASWYNYDSATITETLQVDPLTTVLTNFTVPQKTFGNAAFSLVNPSSNRAGAFTYTSSDTSVATIDGNMVTIVGGGTSTISAVQTGSNNFTEETITAVLTVNRATPTITNFVMPEKTFTDASFNLTPPSSNSSGGFTYTSSNPFVASVSGNVVTIVGAGSCTINAIQAITTSYISGIISVPLVISKSSPTITNLSISTKTIGNSAFIITRPTTNNNTGAFTYTSSNALVATIVGSTVTIVGVGTATITATQAGTANFVSGSITTTMTVIQGTPTLSNFVVGTKTAGDAAFSIVAPRTNSDGAFTYTSSDLSVATIDGSTVTIVGGGTTTITATQASTTNFSSGTITASFTVNRMSPILTNFSVPQKTFGNATFVITPPSSNSNGLMTYTSSNTSVATIAEDVVTIVGAGNTTITAVQAMTSSYASATITVVFQVNPLTTVLTNFSVPAKIPGDADFSLVPPTSNSDGAFTYTSSNPAVATIVDDVVTVVGLGSSTISAVQASTTNYTSRTITSTLAVNLITTALSNFSVSAKTLGDVSFSLVPPTSNSTGAFTYTSSDLLVATIAGDVVTLVGTGTCTIIATQASTFNSTFAVINTSLVVGKTSPVLTNFPVLTKDFGSAAFKLTPPTTNGVGVFTYTSSDPTIATIARDVVTLVGIGTCTITAVQSSTMNFLSGTITTTLTVSQGTPLLTSFAVGTKKIGDAAFSLVAPISNSDGAFTYTSSDTSVATIDGSTVTIVGRGTSTITANQASTTNFLSGSTTALFTVNRITTVLTNFSVGTKTFGDASFNLVAPTSNSDGLFTYTSSDLNVATIDGSTVTIVGGGSATITAVQLSTASYGSESITALFRVNQIKTELSDFSVPTKIIGDETFALVPPTTNGDGAFTYTSSNPAVATVDGDIVTILALGNTTITALQETTANYISDTISTLFQVKLIRTVLTNFVVPTKTVGDVSFSLIPPTTNSTGAFTYTSSNLLVATIAADVVTIVGTGNVTINAVQASTENSTTARITASLIVNKASNSMSWFSVPEKAFGNAPFTLTPPTTASNGAFTYTSSDPTVATIVRDVVTIVGVGTSTITAVQANTVNYEGGTITSLFTVGHGTPVLTNFSVPTKLVGDATFTLVPPTSNSNGAFTYTSSDLTVATIAGDVVTIVGRGSSTITARQSSSTNYALGTITSTLQVNLIPTVLTNFAVATKTFGGAAFTIVPPTTNSDGEFTYTSSDITVATIDDDVVTIVGAGNAIITAVQASTNSYGVGTTTALFTVDPIRTVLTNFVIPAKIIGEGEFSIARPTTASNGEITYTSSDLTVATIDNDVITIVGLGSSIITATQVATDDYTSAKATTLFNVNLITTVLSDFYVPAKIVGDASFSLVAPTTNSAGAFTYTSSNALVATVAADVVTVVGVGTCTITAVQASTPNSTSSIITAPLVVSKTAPTITNFTIPDKVFGNAAFKLTPPTSTNTAGAFTYTSSDITVATIAKDVVTIVGVGSATITAVQASTVSFISGTITTTLTVNLGTSVLTNFSVPTKIGGSAPFSLVAPQSMSDGAFTYTSSNTDVATIDGDVVTIVGAGTATITASQAITDKYLSGSVTATFTVNKITTVLTDFAVASNAVGNAAFSLIPPTTNSNGAITYTSSNLAVATIVGDVVTIVGGGVSTITAVQSGTTNYTSATITALFRVSALTTVLSNFNMPTKAVGNAPFEIVPPTTNGDGAFTYTSSNTAIATIAGNMMTIVGAGSITVTAIQASTENYTSARITTLMIVNKGTPGITNFVMPVKEIGMGDFSIINPTSPSTGEFTYTSSNIKVATVFKNIVSIKSIGTAVITASQAMSANYIGETVTAPFVVNQMSPTLSTAFIVPATKIVGDKTFKLIAPKSNSISPFVFTSSDITVVKIAKDVVTVFGAGTATITATQAATKSYGPKTVTGTITVTKKQTVLINFSIPTKTIGTAPFAIVPPTTNSNGAFTYTSSNEAVATITGNMVTIIGIGNSTITATQAATANFTSQTISTSLVVNLPTPQLGPLQITNKSLSNVSYTIEDPTKPINNTGTWTYSSSDLTKATVSGNVVTLVDSGIVTIRAALSSDSVYNSALLMTQFSISAQNVAPSSFVFVKSSEVAAAIPATFVPSLNVVLPASVSNPTNIAKFNPTLGTIAEKQANQNMVVNALRNMFPMATTISVPTTLLYVPLAFNKSKLKNIKLVRPTGTTVETPLVINTIPSDSTLGFLCSILEVGNCVQLNGVGTFAGNFIKIARGDNNTYSVSRTTKTNVTTNSVAVNGEIINFVGITMIIGYK